MEVVLDATWMIFFLSFFDTLVKFNQPRELDQYRKNTRFSNVVTGEPERRQRETERRRCCRASNDRCVSACVCACEVDIFFWGGEGGSCSLK